MNSILAPFGEPIEDRPKVPTEEERLALRAEKRALKEERRRLARQLDGGAVKGEDVEGDASEK